MRFTTRSCIKYLLFNLAESRVEQSELGNASGSRRGLFLADCLRIDHVKDEIPTF